MATDTPIREIGTMTEEDWKKAKPGEAFKSTNVVSPDFVRTYADEAFLTRTPHNSIELTFSRQETTDIVRSMKFHKMDASGIGLEIGAIASNTASVSVAAVRYPNAAGVDLAVALTRVLYKTSGAELDDKLRTELLAILNA